MGAEDFVGIYRILITIAFAISAINWVGYTVLAPWYKYTLGRIIWVKFLANMLVLLGPFLQFMGINFPLRREFLLASLTLFIIAIIAVGVGIYTTQIKGYVRKRLTPDEKVNL